MSCFELTNIDLDLTADVVNTINIQSLRKTTIHLSWADADANDSTMLVEVGTSNGYTAIASAYVLNGASGYQIFDINVIASSLKLSFLKNSVTTGTGKIKIFGAD